MTNEEAFERWRAAAGPWARWIKPSLFAQAPAGAEARPFALPPVDWAPTSGDAMLVVELPGFDAVATGCALARRGFCPIPLFNTTTGVEETVDAWGIVGALRHGAAQVSARASGPPAFLLDSLRQAPPPDRSPQPLFDNRWFVFGTDFPSVKLLRERAIRRLVVVTQDGTVAPDLCDALAPHAGLDRSVVSLATGSSAPFPDPRPKLARVAATLARKLQRRSDGGYRSPLTQG